MSKKISQQWVGTNPGYQGIVAGEPLTRERLRFEVKKSVDDLLTYTEAAEKNVRNSKEGRAVDAGLRTVRANCASALALVASVPSVVTNTNDITVLCTNWENLAQESKNAVPKQMTKPLQRRIQYHLVRVQQIVALALESSVGRSIPEPTPTPSLDSMEGSAEETVADALTPKFTGVAGALEEYGIEEVPAMKEYVLRFAENFIDKHFYIFLLNLVSKIGIAGKVQKSLVEHLLAMNRQLQKEVQEIISDWDILSFDDIRPKLLTVCDVSRYTDISVDEKVRAGFEATVLNALCAWVHGVEDPQTFAEQVIVESDQTFGHFRDEDDIRSVLLWKRIDLGDAYPLQESETKYVRGIISTNFPQKHRKLMKALDDPRQIEFLKQKLNEQVHGGYEMRAADFVQHIVDEIFDRPKKAPDIPAVGVVAEEQVQGAQEAGPAVSIVPDSETSISEVAEEEEVEEPSPIFEEDQEGEAESVAATVTALLLSQRGDVEAMEEIDWKEVERIAEQYRHAITVSTTFAMRYEAVDELARKICHDLGVTPDTQNCNDMRMAIVALLEKHVLESNAMRVMFGKARIGAQAVMNDLVRSIGRDVYLEENIWDKRDLYSAMDPYCIEMLESGKASTFENFVQDRVKGGKKNRVRFSDIVINPIWLGIPHIIEPAPKPAESEAIEAPISSAQTEPLVVAQEVHEPEIEGSPSLQSWFETFRAEVAQALDGYSHTTNADIAEFEAAIGKFESKLSEYEEKIQTGKHRFTDAIRSCRSATITMRQIELEKGANQVVIQELQSRLESARQRIDQFEALSAEMMELYHEMKETLSQLRQQLQGTDDRKDLIRVLQNGRITLPINLLDERSRSLLEMDPNAERIQYMIEHLDSLMPEFNERWMEHVDECNDEYKSQGKLMDVREVCDDILDQLAKLVAKIQKKEQRKKGKALQSGAVVQAQDPLIADPPEDSEHLVSELQRWCMQILTAKVRKRDPLYSVFGYSANQLSLYIQECFDEYVAAEDIEECLDEIAEEYNHPPRTGFPSKEMREVSSPILKWKMKQTKTDGFTVLYMPTHRGFGIVQHAGIALDQEQVELLKKARDDK